MVLTLKIGDRDIGEIKETRGGKVPITTMVPIT